MSVLLCPFDTTSTLPGAALGAREIWDALCRAHPTGEATPVSPSSKSPGIYGRELFEVARRTSPKLAIGGDHMITFVLLEALVAAGHRPRVVVLDAHHDAYATPLLTHWSVLRFVAEELGLDTLVVGARYENDEASEQVQLVTSAEVREHGCAWAMARIDRFVAGEPLYLSLDVDVLEPTLFPGVGAAVPGGLSVEDTLALVRHLLDHDPIASDVVEYNPLLDPERKGREVLETLMAPWARWLR